MVAGASSVMLGSIIAGVEEAPGDTIIFESRKYKTLLFPRESYAKTLEEIIDEVASTRITERGGRADDKRSEAAMEDRKKEGYF